MKSKPARLMAGILGAILFAASVSGCGGGGSSPASTPGQQASGAEQSSGTASAPSSEAEDSAGGALAEIPLPITQEKTTLRYWYPMSSSNLGQMKDYGESESFMELENRTNIHIEWIHPVGGTELEAFNLLFASSDMPDLIYTQTDEGVKYMYASGPEAAVNDGYFLDITELSKQYAPNYTRLVNSSPDIGKNTVTDSGVRWGFNFIYQDLREANYGPAIRQDFLDRVGLAIPETFEEWHAALTAFKNELGIEAPMYINPDGLSVTSEFLAGYGVGRAFYQVGGQVKYGPMEDAFKDYLDMMTQWYSEGLIDQSFSIRANNVPDDDMMLNDKVGSLDTFATWCGSDYYPSRGAVNPDFNLVGAPIPVKNKGDVTHLRNPDIQVRGSVVAISAKTQYPEIALQWCDYHYSEDGAFLMSFGVREGEDGSYYINDEGIPCWGELITKNPDGLTQSEARTKYTSFIPMHEDYGRIMRARTPAQLAAHKIWTIESSKCDWVLPTSLTMSAEESKKLAGIMGDINTYVQETVVKMIMGTSSVGFDDFRKQIENMGIQEAIGIYQAAMDRYNSR